jgi:division protein CdvB (Snf7/Vps24/ESCRT-III family)
MKKQVNSQKDYWTIMLKEYSKVYENAKNKIARYEDVMSRKSSKSWSNDKKKKFLNRLTSANKELNESFDIINQLQLKLEQIAE